MKVTRPVGVACDRPEPTLTAGQTTDAPFNKPGVPPHNRPAPPARHPAYPPKHAIALPRREACRREPRTLEVTMVLAEAWSATNPGLEQATTRFGTPLIRQRHPQQPGRCRHQLSRIATAWTPSPGGLQPSRIRGDEAVTVMGSRARLDVEAHPQPRVVMARQSAPATDDRSMVASDRSWRT